LCFNYYPRENTDINVSPYGKEFSKHGSMLVRGRLDKVNSSSLAKVLRQPIFKNIQILSCAWVGHSRLVIEVKGDPWQSKESPN